MCNTVSYLKRIILLPQYFVLGFSHRAAACRHAADHLYQIMWSAANLPLPDDCTLKQNRYISSTKTAILTTPRKPLIPLVKYGK